MKRPHARLIAPMRSLDDAARLAGGYVKQSLPSQDPQRDQMISEAIARRKNKRAAEVRS